MSDIKISQEPVVTSMGNNDYFLIDTVPITSTSTSIITKANMLSGLTTPPSGAAGGDFTGTYPNPLLANTTNVQNIVNSIAGSTANIAATVYYVQTVANGGSDSANGKTWGTAFATIAHAFNVINGGSSPTNTHATVYLGDGTFTITSALTITKTQALIGLGPTKTIVQVNYNGIGIIYTGVAPTVVPYASTNYPNTGLKGFTVNQGGSAGNNTVGIQITDIVYPQLTDIYANGFLGSSGVGIWLYNQELPPSDNSSPGGFIERVKFRSVSVDNNTIGILVDRLIGSNSTQGAVSAVTFDNGGSGYAVGDTFTINETSNTGGTNSSCIATVSSISGGGGTGPVTGVTFSGTNAAYYLASGLATTTTTGAGSGAIVTITTLSGSAVNYGNTIFNANNSMEYHDWLDVNVNARATSANAQTGILFQNGTQFYHCYINAQFNITGTDGSHAVAPTAMSLLTSGAMLNCFANLRGEISGGTGTSLNMADSAFILATGVLDFLYNASFSATLGNGSFRFAGLVNGAGLTNNSTSNTNAQLSLIDHVTAGISLQIGSILLDSTHPTFQMLRATNQKLTLQSYDPTNGAISVLDVIQGSSGNTFISALQGLRLGNTSTTGARLFSGTASPNIANSSTGDVYFRSATSPINYAQLLYAATAANTWQALGVYNPSTGIFDVNNNRIVGFNAQASAVGFLVVQNAIAGAAVAFKSANVSGSGAVPFTFATQETGTMKFHTGIDTSQALQVLKADNLSVIESVDSTNGRVGINTSLPTRGLDVVDVAKVQVLIGSSSGTSTPTAAAGTGLGTTPGTITVTGSNTAGTIAVTAGTSCSTNANVMTIWFGRTYTTIGTTVTMTSSTPKTVQVGSTLGFASYGTFLCDGTTVTYTGITSTTFTGCTCSGTPTFTAGDTVISGTTGTASAILLNSGGTGYSANDVLTLTTGGANATVKVLTVNGSGVILTVVLTAGGTGYSISTANATTVSPGGGTGATIDVIALAYAYPAAPYVVLTPGNSATAALAAATIPFVPLVGATDAPTTLTFSIHSNGSAIPNGTNLAWNYHVIG